jgi:hypothetical protein
VSDDLLRSKAGGTEMAKEARDGKSVAATRVVLIGASNVSLGISTIVETARNVCGPKIEVLAAAGFGRSYGIDSVVMRRRLPGIIHCGLWEHLAERPQPTTAALVTDVGNDLLYDVEVSQIIEWVATVVDRLERAQAKVCVTLLPPIEPAQLGEVRFRFFRSLFFPVCRLSRTQVLERATELHDRLQALCQARGIRAVETRDHWYGLDPIHIRRRHRRHAWRDILSHLGTNGAAEVPLAEKSVTRWLYLQTRRPRERTMFGMKQHAAQPSGKLRSGSTVSFY